MIWHPKEGQVVTVNYKDKSMPLQGMAGIVCAVGNGKGPKNVCVVHWVWDEEARISQPHFHIIPRGNLNANKHKWED